MIATNKKIPTAFKIFFNIMKLFVWRNYNKNQTFLLNKTIK